jgi:membrane protein DedA with SNARE-associated domain
VVGFIFVVLIAIGLALFLGSEIFSPEFYTTKSSKLLWIFIIAGIVVGYLIWLDIQKKK